MRAVRFVGVGRHAQVTDVAKPSPGPGQVLIKIGGLGHMAIQLQRMLAPVHIVATDVEDKKLEQAVEVYDKLKAGQIAGRAVLIPEGA